MDLRQRMGLRRRPWDLKTAVLVVPFQKKLFGLIVDEALSLIQLSSEQMEPAPDLSSFMGGLQSQFILGVAKWEEHLTPILNARRIFTVVEIQELGDWQAKDSHE